MEKEAGHVEDAVHMARLFADMICYFAVSVLEKLQRN